ADAAGREVDGDRVEVGQAGQVADDRADGAATSSSRRERVARRAGAANLLRDLGRQLEHLPVEEDEAGEPQLVDQGELLFEPLPRAALVAVRPSVALLEGFATDCCKLLDGRRRALREVGGPVAEL